MITRRQVFVGLAGVLGAVALSKAGVAVAGEAAPTLEPVWHYEEYAWGERLPTEPVVTYQVFRGRIPIFGPPTEEPALCIDCDYQPTPEEHQGICEVLREQYGPGASIRVVHHTPRGDWWDLDPQQVMIEWDGQNSIRRVWD